jgi:hypothetical protein
LLVLYI